jgi:hypothetical protein
MREDHGQLRAHAIEESSHRPRQIDGHVSHVDALAEQRLRTRATGGRDRGQHQRDVGKPLEQRLDQRFGRLHFTDRNRMHPDATTRDRGAETEALRKTLPVTAVAEAAQRQRPREERRQ